MRVKSIKRYLESRIGKYSFFFEDLGSGFVYGFNEGVFPSRRAIEESKRGEEEERRLAYVAITRARKKLYLTCNQDYSYVMGTNLRPSRF